MSKQDRRIKAVLLDMDGVLWKGTEPILDVNQLLGGFQDLGCQVFCVTNNSTQTVEEYQARLGKLGAGLDAAQIVTSAEATAAYLADRFPPGSRVYVVGEDGLRDTIQKYGFELAVLDGSPEVQAVVIGLDRGFIYEQLNQAVQHIRRGAAFIGTNPDRTIPTPQGPAPGTGAIVELIETSCGEKALMIGKPAEPLYRLALDRAGTLPDETLMIGDRLETDICGAQKVQLRTGLVLSGIATRNQAADWQPQPDIIAEDAQGILEELTRNDGKLL